MEYTFAEFFAVWATSQKWKIPKVHLRILQFLEDENWINDSKVLLLWRGIGKSTIVDLWVAYKLSKNPELRFLILSAEHRTAKKGSQDILFVINNHPLCTHLISDNLETRKDSFYVRGSTDQRNPSVVAHGIMSNVTGGRADYIIYDDVEVQKNSGNETKREDLRRRIAETAHLLVPKIVNSEIAGRRLFIGTYHDPVSIYDEAQENGSEALKVPLITDIEGHFPNITGKSNWPERFGLNKVSSTQKLCTGKSEFYSQYLLIPTGIEDSLLNPELAQIYNDEIDITEANGHTVARIGKNVIKSVSVWWDPALSEARRDDSVLAVVYTSVAGDIFVHRAIELKGDGDAQCRQVKRIALDLEIPIVKIETNGIGNFLPQMLLKHVGGLGIGVEGVASTQNKNQKIVEALETPLYGGFLFVSKQVVESKFLGQVRDFNPNTKNNKDDYIDAVSSAIKQEPIRIAGQVSFSSRGINTSWMGEGTSDIQRDEFTF